MWQIGLLHGFTTEESTLSKDRLGVDLEEDEFKIPKDIRKDPKRNIEYLGDTDMRVQEFNYRIEEMRLIGKRLWKRVEENPQSRFYKGLFIRLANQQ